jgi:NodT family efflux transporter outer membrane factor (OMF) lipoprotein
MFFEYRLPSARHRRVTAAVSSAALLAGCMVGPDFSHPETRQPDGYTSENLNLETAAGREDKQSLAIGKKISGEWWRLFHSTRLNRVLEEALAGNLNLAAAKATLAQARDAVDQAAGALWPHAQLTAGVSRQQTNQASLGINSPHVVSNLFTVGPNVSYALDLFGGTRRQVEQQEALAEFQEYQLAAAYLSLTGDVVTQAIAIASAREQVKVIRDIIADDEKNVKLQGDLLALSEATRTDVEQARSQLTADRTLLPPLRQQQSVARHAMAVLIGKAPSEWTAPDFDLSEFTLPDELPLSLPSELVRQRPDILAAEAQLHAASAAIGVATAQLYPNITLTASFAQQALSPGNVFMGASSIWSIASQLTAPIFQGGALEAQKQGAVDAFVAKSAGYQQTILTSFGQVADVLTAIENDAQLLDQQRSASESAGTTRQLIGETFRTGSVTVLQVLDAERQYEQARLGYTKAKAQRLLDSAQLYNAMGGGWWDWRAKESKTVGGTLVGREAEN